MIRPAHINLQSLNKSLGFLTLYWCWSSCASYSIYKNAVFLKTSSNRIHSFSCFLLKATLCTRNCTKGLLQTLYFKPHGSVKEELLSLLCKWGLWRLIKTKWPAAGSHLKDQSKDSDPGCLSQRQARLEIPILGAAEKRIIWGYLVCFVHGESFQSLFVGLILR